MELISFRSISYSDYPKIVRYLKETIKIHLDGFLSYLYEQLRL